MEAVSTLLTCCQVPFLVGNTASIEFSRVASFRRRSTATAISGNTTALPGRHLAQSEAAKLRDDHLGEHALVLVDHRGFDPVLVPQILQLQRCEVRDGGVGGDCLLLGVARSTSFSRSARSAAAMVVPVAVTSVVTPSLYWIRLRAQYTPSRTCVARVVPQVPKDVGGRPRPMDPPLPQRGRLDRDSETPALDGESVPRVGAGVAGTSSNVSRCSATHASRSARRYRRKPRA